MVETKKAQHYPHSSALDFAAEKSFRKSGSLVPQNLS